MLNRKQLYKLAIYIFPGIQFNHQKFYARNELVEIIWARFKELNPVDKYDVLMRARDIKENV